VITTAVRSLGEGPTLPVVLSNVVTTLSLTIGACTYIAKGGGGKIGENRDEIERYFIVSSFAFFIGWMWFVVARDAVVVFCEIILKLFSLAMGEDGVEAQPVQRGAEVVSVLLVCPALTAAFVLWQRWLLRFVAELDADRGESRADMAGLTTDTGQGGRTVDWKASRLKMGALTSLAWVRLSHSDMSGQPPHVDSPAGVSLQALRTNGSGGRTHATTNPQPRPHFAATPASSFNYTPAFTPATHVAATTNDWPDIATTTKMSLTSAALRKQPPPREMI